MNPSTPIALKVSEAVTEDVGRGIVRLDPTAMDALGVEAGDVVSIVGPATAVAKAMPTRPADRNHEIVQMDGVLRANAKVKLDTQVTLQSTRVRPALQVVLKPLTISAHNQHHNTLYLKKSLLNLPVQQQDQVRVNLFGTGFENFKVTHTQPSGPVLITVETALTVEAVKQEEEQAALSRISYEDIGGLKHQLDHIREMIELPLKYPQLFEQLGIDPPKGVLLYGPPGTGKTLIARALADEIDAHFISIAGPEVLSMYYGQSEANLRKLFNEAKRRQPSILFLDEIDALTPKRAEVTGEVEKRVVSQLLTLMDGLERRQQVIVIGATNRPEALDPALRRPGRFDREIRVPIPDAAGRMEILKIHTRGMPLHEDVDLTRLSQITHGFVGADLESFTREAAMKSLRRILPSLDLESDAISYDTLFNLRVERRDFEIALNEIEPSAMREVTVEIPLVRWTDVGGLDEIKARLKEMIEWPDRHRDLFERYQLQPPSGILLSGPPGTGKTLLAQAVAHECGVNFISIKGPELMSRFVGESEKRIRDVFQNARRAAPCIVFMDELDALGSTRGSHLSDTGDTITSQLLTELDGMEGLRGVTVIGATNRKQAIDPALLRPGRFELHLETRLPDQTERAEIFSIHTRNLPLNADVDINALAAQTNNLDGSQIAFVCREATMTRLRHTLNESKESSQTLDLCHDDFQTVITSLKTQPSTG